MATAIAPEPGVSTADTLERLTSQLRAKESLLAELNARTAEIETEAASLRTERSDLLCKAAELGAGADSRAKAQKRIDALDETQRNLDRQEEGLRLLITKAEQDARSLRDELEKCQRQAAEEQRLARVRELKERAGGELTGFLASYEQAAGHAARLHLALEQMRDLGDDARQAAERMKARFLEASPATLERYGWKFVGSRHEFRIMPMLPPATE